MLPADISVYCTFIEAGVHIIWYLLLYKLTGSIRNERTEARPTMRKIPSRVTLSKVVVLPLLRFCEAVILPRLLHMCQINCVIVICDGYPLNMECRP
jgi:hypothetical protein